MSRFSDAAAARVLSEIHESEVIGLLKKLVSFPTVNPPGDTRDAAAYCADLLSAHGFRTRLVGRDDLRSNLIAEYGEKAGPTLVMCAHLDIVPPGDLSGWTNDPFEATVRDGRIYGRGTNDDKGSVAAQMMAAIALVRSGVPIEGRVILAEVADEETGGQFGVVTAIEDGGLNPDYVLIGEPTAGRVAIGEKGSLACHVITRGKTAHGALPWEGVNAIEAMAEVIVALRRELWPKLSQRTHPLFMPSGGTVNLIEGGVKANVVPDVCKIYIDRRALPGDDYEAAIQEVREIAERAIAGIPGASVEVLPRTPVSPAVLADPDSDQVRAFVAANEYLDLDPELTAFSMGTDGRFFSRRGHDTIIYGPGDPRVAHIQDEYVGVEEVMSATRAYALTALGLLGGKETKDA